MRLPVCALMALLLGSGLSLEADVLYSVTDLGTLPGGTRSRAYGINNAGQVTGYSDGHAFVYSNGQMMDLNALIDPALGVTLLEGRGINDSGQIVANSAFRAYLLTPIPEPGTLALLGAALAALPAFRRTLRRVRT